MTDAMHAAAVAEMMEARATVTALDAFSDGARPADLDAGYAVQDALDVTLTERGEKVAGWKIAASGEEPRAMFDLSEPFTGRVYASTLFESPAALPSADFHQRGVEGEFAFRMASDLPARDTLYINEDVAEAAGTLHPAIEIVSPRFADWLGVGAPTIVADNASNGGLVIGRGVTDWRALDLASSRVTMTIDGEQTGAGEGRLAYGDPLTALTWCVNHLSARGILVARGAVITTGTCTGIQFAEAGASVVAQFTDLDDVRIDFTA